MRVFRIAAALALGVTLAWSGVARPQATPSASQAQASAQSAGTETGFGLFQQRCMGCHRFVATGHPEVIALRRHWQQRVPIPWVQVTSLPRFVHFTHAAHVRANVACQECHGAVETMDRVAPAHDLTMGWCLGCHRQRQAPVDCLTCHY